MAKLVAIATAPLRRLSPRRTTTILALFLLQLYGPPPFGPSHLVYLLLKGLLHIIRVCF